MDPNTKSFMDAINNQVIYFMGACVGVGIAMMIRALRYTPDSRQQKEIEAQGRLLAAIVANTTKPITVLRNNNSVMIYYTGDPAKIPELVDSVLAVAKSWSPHCNQTGRRL